MNIKNINQVNTNFEDFTFSYNEESSYGKKALKKYKDYVTSYRITDKSCFILLSGKNKFFGFRFTIESYRVNRIINLKIFSKYVGVITNKPKFRLFNKMLILEKLK